jgi:predicted ribosome quality control (RQC) complex YloA/Tae2 family protein
LEEMAQAVVKSFEEIRAFQRRWSEIGFVPIRHKEELQKQYKAALDKLFATIRSADREQQINKFKNKVSSMREAGDKRLRTEREKLYNRVKQLEQEIQTLENNIGFFAKSKGVEAMIAAVEEKIARAKQEMADAIERVKLIDSQE